MYNLHSVHVDIFPGRLQKMIINFASAIYTNAESTTVGRETRLSVFCTRIDNADQLK